LNTEIGKRKLTIVQGQGMGARPGRGPGESRDRGGAREKKEGGSIAFKVERFG